MKFSDEEIALMWQALYIVVRLRDVLGIRLKQEDLMLISDMASLSDKISKYYEF